MLNLILVFFVALLLFLLFSSIYMKLFLFKYSRTQKKSYNFFFKQFQNVEIDVLENEISKLSKQLSNMLLILTFLGIIALILSQILNTL